MLDISLQNCVRVSCVCVFALNYLLNDCHSKDCETRTEDDEDDHRAGTNKSFFNYFYSAMHAHRCIHWIADAGAADDLNIVVRWFIESKNKIVRQTRLYEMNELHSWKWICNFMTEYVSPPIQFTLPIINQVHHQRSSCIRRNGCYWIDRRWIRAIPKHDWDNPCNAL